MGLVDAATDADVDAPMRDSARPPPLPSAADFLPSTRYDCGATGPFEAPARSAPRGCYRDVSCTERLIAAHRMAVPFAPENTLSALRAAILLGVDIVETDIRLTSDDEVVLLHDSEVDRTYEGTGLIRAMTLSEAQALAATVPRGVSGDFGCDRMPTLPEVFALSRGQVVVELEVKDTLAGVRAAEYLRDQGLYDDAFLLCDPGECDAARAAVPDVPIMTRPHSTAELMGALAYDPPPAMVHIDPGADFLNADTTLRIHAGSAHVYASAFLEADPAAVLMNDISGYPAMFDRGIDVLQVQYGHWALLSLGRLSSP